MSLKVGQQTITMPSASTSRSAAANHAAPTDLFQQVSGLSGANTAGPDSDTLDFSSSWGGFQSYDDRGQKKGNRSLLDGVRFGDILATEEVGTTLVNYQAMHDVLPMPTLRFGAMLYENAMRAVTNNGVVRPLGGTVNRLL